MDWAVCIDWDGPLTDDIADRLVAALHRQSAAVGTTPDGLATVQMTLAAEDAAMAAIEGRRTLWEALQAAPWIHRIAVMPFTEFERAGMTT